MAVSDVASNIILNMGNGSGIDIIKLSRDLTDAEQLPKKEKINEAQSKTEASISAIAVLKYNVEQLKLQFDQLNDAQELAIPAASSNNSSAVSINNTFGDALDGRHEISITQLAANQKNRSIEFSSSTQILNAGAAFDITLNNTSSGSTSTISIGAGADTPAGVVAAINKSGSGYSASLIDTGTAGTNYRIVIQGASGADNGFTISSAPDLGFGDNGNTLQTATNARLNVDGIDIERSSNVIDDAITGVELNISGLANSAVVNVTSDTLTLKTKLQDLVTIYNDVQLALNELSNPDSIEEEVGGALSGDMALIRSVRDTIYKAVTTDSSTPSGNVTALRDIGVEVTKTGTLSFNESKYDGVAQGNFSDIVTMLSAGTTNQSKYDSADKGLAFDAMERFDTLLDPFEGIFVTRTKTANIELTRYQDELEKLEKRMEAVYARYVSQFSAMESLVNTLNSTKDYVKNQLDSISKIGKDT